MDYAFLDAVTNTSDESDEETSENKKLFFMASALGHINRLKEYLDDGIDIETKDYVFGETIFIRACRHDHIDILEFAHCRDANVNAASNSGETALHVATKNSSYLCVKYLLSIPQVEKDYQDKLGQTPLMVAAFKSSVQCVDMLLSADCDANLQDCHGRTALHRALDPYDNFLGKHNACLCVELLTETDCDINHADLNGDTPLHMAIKKYNWKAVKWLISENCDIDKHMRSDKDLAIFSQTKLPAVPTSPFLLALNFLNVRFIKYLILCGCSYYEYARFINYCEKNAVIYEFLENAFSGPRSLKENCRKVIRKSLGRPIYDKIHSLHIPEILRDFLLLKDLNID
ncbi:hypothetical protein SNE40_014596 [Patella caerulea]|uniref:SOCS box domain-containing protein n=1 Tax=Patella caerulea TaxID=87958 RepID=A0AAN8JIL5_PATCE